MVNKSDNPAGMVPEGEVTFAEAIGQRIAQVRGKSTIVDFAVSLGIHKNTLMNYEKGERIPPADLVARICISYSVETKWLLLGDGPKNSEEASVQAQAGQPEVIDSRKLKTVLSCFKSAVIECAASITPFQEAEIISVLYTLSDSKGAVPKSAILHLLNLVK